MPADASDAYWPDMTDGELEELGLLLLSDEDWSTYATQKGLHDLLDLDGASLVTVKDDQVIPKDAEQAASVKKYQERLRKQIEERRSAQGKQDGGTDQQ